MYINANNLITSSYAITISIDNTDNILTIIQPNHTINICFNGGINFTDYTAWSVLSVQNVLMTSGPLCIVPPSAQNILYNGPIIDMFVPYLLGTNQSFSISSQSNAPISLYGYTPFSIGSLIQTVYNQPMTIKYTGSSIINVNSIIVSQTDTEYLPIGTTSQNLIQTLKASSIAPVMTNNSAYYLIYTGTSDTITTMQNDAMPGMSYNFYNRSAYDLQINAADSSPIITISTMTSAIIVCLYYPSLTYTDWLF